jgi:16S rRNA (uracil1498-N3)-methyltransferase
LRIRLLLSIIKFDHFEWCIEKATELGVSEIVPLAAARSEKALIAATEKRSRRWEKILVESAQQSRRLRAPKLAAVLKPDAAFAGASQTFQRIVLSERPEAPAIRSVLGASGNARNQEQPPGAIDGKTAGDKGEFGQKPGAASSAPTNVSAPLEVALAVGPEGGWTDEEIQTASQAGYLEVSLGKNILRTETAVIAALAIINYALGE